MCTFFSFATEPGTGYNSGKRFYFDWKYRKMDLEDGYKINNSYHHDSHSSICRYYELSEDICNKYEYNPFTKIFKIDRINSSVDDSIQVKDWIRNLDFKKVIEPLIIKDAKYPLIGNLDKDKIYINDHIIVLLRNWSLSQNGMRRYLDHYLTEQVGSPVKDLAYDYVRNLLFKPIWNLISMLIGNKEDMWDSVLNSVIAYSGSFFNVDYQVGVESSNELWDMGFIPSFDGNVWRLHSGNNADIVFTIKQSDLLNFRIR